MTAPVFSDLDNTITAAIGVPRVIDSNATVIDPDLAPGDSYGNTVLSFAITNGDPFLDIDFGASGTLTFTGTDEVRVAGLQVGTFFKNGTSGWSIAFNASATAADVASVLQQITVAINAPAAPTDPTLTVVFFTSSGGISESREETVSIVLDRTNDRPVLTNVAASAGYLAGAAIPLSTQSIISDVDSVRLAGATVRVTDGAAGDILSADTGTTGIGASYDAATHTLTLSGARTLAEYQQVLATVGYASSAADPTAGGSHPARTIAWQLDDGGATNNLSAVQTTTLQFAAGAVIPFVDLDASGRGTGTTARFVEQGAAVPIVDVDNLVISGGAPVHSATIVLTNAKDGDLLDVSGALPGLAKDIDASVPGQITLTLTGAATASAYQSALRQVTFGNSNDDPDTTQRDIAVTLLNGNIGNTAHATVTVNAAGDVVTALEGTILAVAGENGLLANDTDPDGALTVVGIGSVSAAGNRIFVSKDGAYHYLPLRGFSGTDSVTYTVEDPLHHRTTATLTINVLPQADTPRLSMADDSLNGPTRLGGETTLPHGPDQQVYTGSAIALAGGGYVVAADSARAFEGPQGTEVEHDSEFQVFDANGSVVATHIVSGPAEESFNLAVAALPNGSFVAAWLAVSASSTQETHAQIFSAAGTPIGPQISLPANSPVTVLSDGSFLTRSFESSSSTLQIFDDQGQAGSTITVPLTSPLASGTLTADRDGGFIASRIVADPDHQSVIAQRYAADGTPLGAEITVKESILDAFHRHFTQTIVAGQPDGSFMVVWGEPAPGDTGLMDTIVHAQVVGANDQLLGPETIVGEQVSTSIYGSFIAPKVTALSHGYVVTWEAPFEYVNFGHVAHSSVLDVGLPVQWALTARVFDDDGRPLSGDVVVQINEGQTEFGTAFRSDRVAALPDGGFAVAVNDYQHDANAFDAVVHVFDADGNRVGSKTAVHDALPGVQRAPSLAALANGEIVAGWVAQATDQGAGEFVSRLLDPHFPATMQEDGALAIPLKLEFGDSDGSESVHHLEIAGAPAGATIAGPAGTVAAFDSATGVWTITGAFTPSFGLTFTPAHDFNGDFRLLATVVIEDGSGGPQARAGLAIQVQVAPVNDGPDAGTPVKLAAIDQDSGARLITQGELIANAGDADHDPLTAINLAIASGKGALADNHDGTWSYTPAAGDDTSVSFSFAVTDGTASTPDSATLDILAVQHDIPVTPGTPGDDSFTAGPGAQQYDAGLGIDTITFGFKLTEATVAYAGNKVIIDGPANHTVLSGFEVFKFTDGTVNNNDGDWLVDDLFYYTQNNDVWNAHADADAHYHQDGFREGRDPSAFFSTSTYLSMNPDVKAAGVDPLTHFHQFGWNEGRAPSIAFDPAAYLAANPDVKAAHLDPLAHFLSNGAQEGRQPIAFDHLLAANGFDYVYYLEHNPDVAAAHVDPLQHFETTGWKEGRNPNALFDTNGYLAAYGDVAAAHINPLDHYNVSGWHEGRDPSAGFDTTDYLSHYPDVAAANINPLVHFLSNGQAEGRSPFADGHFG
jgi:hypothetical protein